MADLTDHWRFMARYNRWQNNMLMDLAEQMPDAERKSDKQAFFSSVHTTFNHILLADIAWLKRFSNWMGWPSIAGMDFPVPLENGLATVLYEDFADFRAAREDMDARIFHWVHTDLPDDRTGETVHFKSMQGLDRKIAVWVAISHMFNHATHHRGQIGTLLMQAGLKPGVTDMPFTPDDA